MIARQSTSGKTVNRMLAYRRNRGDLLAKLEAVRLVCKVSGCAQRYLAHDAFNGIFQATKRADDAHGSDTHQRFLAYLHDAQDKDLALGVAMTDAKGDRSKRPGQQANRDVYVHIKERRPDGIVIRGTKAIVTGAPTCTTSSSCPAARMQPRMRISRCAAPCRSTRPASPSSRGPQAGPAKPRRNSRQNTASRRAW